VLLPRAAGRTLLALDGSPSAALVAEQSHEEPVTAVAAFAVAWEPASTVADAVVAWKTWVVVQGCGLLALSAGLCLVVAVLIGETMHSGPRLESDAGT
jgi:hypothetical protein